MDSIRKFFTLEEDSFSSDSLNSESVSASSAPVQSPAGPPLPRRNNVVGLPTNRKEEIVVLEPASFADAREIAEALKVKKSILLNMRKTDKELARRIIDFLSGISYAIGGHSQKVADQIFLFTPSHIEILVPDPNSYQAQGGEAESVSLDGL
ncbi:MAG: cell division protein SepF [Candidatus Eremiobacterota bacterium]